MLCIDDLSLNQSHTITPWTPETKIFKHKFVTLVTKKCRSRGCLVRNQAVRFLHFLYCILYNLYISRTYNTVKYKFTVLHTPYIVQTIFYISCKNKKYNYMNLNLFFQISYLRSGNYLVYLFIILLFI